MTDVLIKRGSVDTDVGTQGDAAWRWELCSHRTSDPQKLGERPGTDPSLDPSEEHGPANTMISDFWTPELETRNFCHGSHSVWGTLLCYGSPSKLILFSMNYSPE